MGLVEACSSTSLYGFLYCSLQRLTITVAEDQVKLMKKLKYLTKLKSRDTGYFTLTVKEKTKWILLSVDRQVTRQPGANENKIRSRRI